MLGMETDQLTIASMRTPEEAAALTLSMSSSFVPTLPMCGKVKVTIWPA